jgi:hypothetical protein
MVNSNVKCRLLDVLKDASLYDQIDPNTLGDNI